MPRRAAAAGGAGGSSIRIKLGRRECPDRASVPRPDVQTLATALI